MRILSLCFVIAFLMALDSNVWCQEEGAITQNELAIFIGEKLGFKENYIANLKRIGITPLGEWDAEKPLTKEDFDAILIRLARRNPLVEKIEPDKLLDSIGFPARQVSKTGVSKILASPAFQRAIINPKLLLAGRLIPLPFKYKIMVAEHGMVPYKVEIAATEEAIEEVAEVTVDVVIPPEPPPVHQ